MNKRKCEYISEENGDYQKKIAIKMWQFVKKWYVTHPNEYRHPMWIKDEFHHKYFDKTGQRIDWEASCMLCNIFYDDACVGCPLHSDDEDIGFCADYFKLSDAYFPFHMRPSVCDRIIEAIRLLKEPEEER